METDKMMRPALAKLAAAGRLRRHDTDGQRASAGCRTFAAVDIDVTAQMDDIAVGDYVVARRRKR